MKNTICFRTLKVNSEAFQESKDICWYEVKGFLSNSIVFPGWVRNMKCLHSTKHFSGLSVNMEITVTEIRLAWFLLGSHYRLSTWWHVNTSNTALRSPPTDYDRLLLWLFQLKAVWHALLDISVVIECAFLEFIYIIRNHTEFKVP